MKPGTFFNLCTSTVSGVSGLVLAVDRAGVIVAVATAASAKGGLNDAAAARLRGQPPSSASGFPGGWSWRSSLDLYENTPV